MVDSIRVVVSLGRCDRRCLYIARLHNYHMGHIKVTRALIFLFLHLYKFVFFCRAYDSMGAYSFVVCRFIRSVMFVG
jgi:hypothetical protein